MAFKHFVHGFFFNVSVNNDVAVNVSGMDVANVAASLCDLVVHCQKMSNCHCMFTFPASISQTTFGGRLGNNVCTLIAMKFGAYCFQHKLETSLLWNQLPSIWVNSMVNAICDGNEVYDELYCDTAVLLDVANAVGDNYLMFNQLISCLDSLMLMV